LQKAGWLNAEKATSDLQRLTAEAFDVQNPVLPQRSQIRNLIEFGRAVHAEMAAIVDAARRGVSTEHASMFVTAFPCHLCARHIVAAGIDYVFFIEPYAKSRTAELYPDSIALESSRAGVQQVLFQPFVGVAPRQYMSFFTATKRKKSDGSVLAFQSRGAVPRHEGIPRVYLESEDEQVARLTTAMHQQGILFK
jgi:cytidine deaminase